MEITSRDILIYFAIKYKGDWENIMTAIKNKEEFVPNELLEVVKNMKCKAITLMDEEYPDSLKHIFKPPLVLFYYGDISLLKNFNTNLAVVGSREPTTYAKKHIVDMVKELALEYTIISGCALGVDALAQTTAIQNGGRSIGVLGSGINLFLPKTNGELIEKLAKDHLLLSEYPENVEPKPENYVIRNRIVVGLSKSVLVFDVKPQSGTLSTVTLATNYDRNILSIPYPLGTEFLNNSFIKEGCYLVENADDIRFLNKNF